MHKFFLDFWYRWADRTTVYPHAKDRHFSMVPIGVLGLLMMGGQQAISVSPEMSDTFYITTAKDPCMFFSFFRYVTKEGPSKGPHTLRCHIPGPPIKGQQIQAAQSHHRVDDPGHPVAPEEEGDQVKIKKPDQPPVYRAHDANGERCPI